jgi:hypothetical protein
MNRTGVSIEAKRKYIKASNRTKISGAVASTIACSLKEVARIDEGDAFYGMCFFPIYFLAREFENFEENSRILIGNEVEKFVDNTEDKLDLLAW